MLSQETYVEDGQQVSFVLPSEYSFKWFDFAARRLQYRPSFSYPTRQDAEDFLKENNLDISYLPTA